MRPEPIVGDDRDEQAPRSDRAADATADESLRFDDPAWDDEYCTWLDNGLRTCCS